MAFFSIILPCYNCEKYIQQCINSILKQSYSDYEIIIIENGSTDHTAEIINSYNCNKIKVIVLSENQGVSCARNIGIEQAIGKYICFIDSDDYIMPDALEKFKKSIDAMPYSDLYIGNIVPFVDHAETDSRDDFKEGKMDIDNINKCSKDNFLEQLIEKNIYTCFVMRTVYDREFIQTNQLFFMPGIWHEDEEWTTKVYIKAHTIKYVDNNFYFYRIHSNSLMHGENLRHKKDEIRYISLLKIIVSIYQYKLKYDFSEAEIKFIQSKLNYYLWILPDEIKDFNREDYPLLYEYMLKNHESILCSLSIITYEEEKEWMINLINSFIHKGIMNL